MASNVFKYGDNIDTDGILPARYLALYQPTDLARHCMEDVDADFAGKVRVGDVLVAGENFGCGSSREHAPIAIQASGVVCVVAASFARIFYRNALNIGLPIFESPEAAARIQAANKLEVDLRRGEIRNLTLGESYVIGPFPPFIQNIIEAGGLLATTVRRS